MSAAHAGSWVAKIASDVWEVTVRVTLWNEYIHERKDDSVRAIYPDGMHAVWEQALRTHLGDAASVRSAWLEQPDNGLPAEVLDETDVLFWWGHIAHDRVADEVAERVAARVRAGMGLVALHSAHYSKVFKLLMGTTCSLRWRSAHDRELVWTVDPTHPVAQGVPSPIVIPEQEMYGEFFDVPPPDDLVFVSSFSGGEVFRGGLGYKRGFGRVFYFSPGDQEYPVYHHPDVQRVLANAARWVAPREIRSAAYTADHAPTGWFE